MKKIYMTPKMEILDSELEGILAASTDPNRENGSQDDFDARQSGFGFDDFDDFEEDDY